MAKTREDFVAEGKRAARAKYAAQGPKLWKAAMPEFGEGKSWQAKAFAEGFTYESGLIQSERDYADDSKARKELDRSKPADPRWKINEACVAKIAEGYIAAALWASTDEDGESLYDVEPSPIMRSHALTVAERFLRDHPTDAGAFVDLYPRRVSYDYDPWEALGHDLWLSRSGAGVGFSDRNMGRVGARLDAAAYALGPMDCYVGDDGLAHIG